MLKALPAFFLVLVFCLFASAQTANDRLLFGRVAANQTRIAFTYAGKIWLVDRAGGGARRLTNTPNEETHPVFSPDGQRLAFSRSNGNDWDVFVIAMNTGDGAGEAKRVTYMGEDDMVVAWTPDGKEVVFETTRDEEGMNRLYKIAVDGGTLATALPLPQAFQGSFSPDGNSIAYNPRAGFGEWRYYRGGSVAPIWIADLKTGAVEKLPNQNFNDRFPMWRGDKIYFTSDRTGIFNLFVHDLKTKQVRQLTKFDDQGVRFPSAAAVSSSGGDAICFVQDGRIHLFDLKTNQDRIVDISVAAATGDSAELAPRTVNAMRFLEQIMPSADGEKIAFGARGEVLIYDTDKGDHKNLTNTSGTAERYPVISPDNRSVAYFSDESGEYALHIRSLAQDTVKKIAIEKQPSFYWAPTWSPDSKKLAFAGKDLELWLADVEAGVATKIDTSDYSSQDDWSPNFSPDSRFLAYAKRLKNRVGTIFIYDPAQKKSFQITDGQTHTQTPVFDANGKYLYFVSSLNALTSEFGWGVLNSALANPLMVRRVHALMLTKGTAPLNLPTGAPNPDAKVSEAVTNVKIDLADFERRFLNLRLPPRDYSRLATGKPGKLLLVAEEWAKTPGNFNERNHSQAVYSFDTAKGGEMQKIADEIDALDITGDGSRILYRKGRDFFLAKTDEPAKAGEGKQDFSKMQIAIDPKEEWRQIFNESIRIMRDWFYDRNYHGQDLAALKSYYGAYLPRVTRRADLNLLMQRMLGSVSVSHLGIGGGDQPSPAGGGNSTGLLGADYAIENGHYRFKKIYRSTSYAAANGSFNAPLDQPGIDISEGDYLLEINGQKVDTGKNIFTYFENTAGKPVKITVTGMRDDSATRTYTVYPAAGENRLRRANWAENNRKLVDKLSNGKVGYIFIESYGFDGIGNAMRGLTAYAGKAGVIIDQRFNGGGITPDYLIEWLRRKPLYYYKFRDGEDIATPVNPAPPVKVMIIDELNGSAAETGAFMFKLGKVGTLVGKRTYGAGIGPYFFTPQFVDNGRIQLPNRAAYDPSGNWGIENYGVVPDVDVDVTPQDLLAGRDSQLIKAVEVALQQITKNPVVPPKRPAFPVHPRK